MRHRSPARLLAPLALLVAFGAFALVVTSNGSDSSKSSAPATRSPAVRSRRPAASRAARQATAPRPSRGRLYTVVAGDTLGTIAAKTGVSVAELRRLNPRADPRALQTGEKLRLK